MKRYILAILLLLIGLLIIPLLGFYLSLVDLTVVFLLSLAIGCLLNEFFAILSLVIFDLSDFLLGYYYISNNAEVDGMLIPFNQYIGEYYDHGILIIVLLTALISFFGTKNLRNWRRWG